MSSTSAFRDSIPFIKDLGIVFVDAGDGRSHIELEVEPRHLNSWDVVHGGVLMSLLDVAMAVAGRSLDPEAGGGVTVEMKTSFMQPATPRGRLVARGHCVHRTSTMAFCEGEIRDQRDRLVARSSGTFKYLKQRPPTPADA